MTTPAADGAGSTLREWLRNERRLGARHVPRPRASAQRPGEAEPADAEGRETHAFEAAPASADSARREQTPSAASPAVTLALAIADDPDLPPLCSRVLPAAAAAAELEALDSRFVRGCTRCGLHAARTQTVFGVGNPRPDVVFVGEGPGADEDAQGLPFVGRAGQLLTRMIAAMTLTREQVYICNVVKCRPPGNRTPTDDEMETCSPFLFRQLAVLRPKVIIALGRPATQTLLATRAPISALRGRFHDFPPPALRHLGLPSARLMPTFHPAYLLRSPQEKGKAWEDLKQVMRFLGLRIPSG